MTTDPARDLAAIREATDGLLAAVGKLDDAALGEPSRLPGWTRGHVLAHLARNADALVNLFTAARTDTVVPMYPSEEARDADIERDATRPLAVQLDDLAVTASRFNDAAAALNPEAWSRRVAVRGGVTEIASRIPFRRLAEVELHHVDLGIGRTVEDLPADFVEAELASLAGGRFAGRDDVPALLLRTAGGRALRTGREGGEPAGITGSSAALVGWLTGRTDGSGLDAGGSALPVLPPLG